MAENRELVYLNARLTKENKKLTKESKKLNAEIELLKKQNEDYKNILGKIPDDLLPKEAKSAMQTKTLRFKMATVLYLDIQGFKKISEQRDANVVIDELDQIFYHFDTIVKKYKIEKIRTVGDSYMCAGGVPIKNITNPIDVVLAALEMQEYLKELKLSYEEKGQAFWDLKLGIHTGPVTATIRGKKKISYDLSGEVVNIATRIASSSEIGKINVSETTHILVQGYFVCKENGSIPVKYQGNLEMYFINRIKPAFSLNRKKGIFPNDIFRTRYLTRQFTDLQEVILDKLERELPKYLYYHDVRHTIDVVNQAEIIGIGEGVDDELILLLITAALFHDIGHTISYDEHEYLGTQIAKEMLPKYNYTEQQISEICRIIMATKIPPNPQDILEKIICDSDLDYLGRRDFINISNTLYEELKEQNKIGSLNDWNKLQVKFLGVHQFYTKTSQQLREVNKQSQIDRIKDLIVDDDE